MNTALEEQRRNRIRVAIFAYAYEFLSHSFVPDAEFDKLCLRVEAGLGVDTDRPDLDSWFRTNFSAHTGQWIHGHPDRNTIAKQARYLVLLLKSRSELIRTHPIHSQFEDLI